jgi:hemoglobin-like flavoprotein
MRIDESIDRVLRSKTNFGESFYALFFQRCPEVVDFFRDVDMERQATVLTMAVSLVGQNHSRRYPATERYLQVLGSQHHRWGVPREAYPKWQESMMETLRTFHGEDWSADLAAEWQEAFDEARAAMFAGYERHFGV